MDYRELVIEIEHDIASVSINRPQKGNALSDLMVAELTDFFSKKPSTIGARIAVLSGVGEKFFCAGSDINDLMKKDTAALSEGFLKLAQLYETVRKSEIISISAVQGLALGGGFGLAASCDIAIAADSARFGLPEINLGIGPMIVLLPVMKTIGTKRTFLLAARGNIISAREAMEAGLLSGIVKRTQLGIEAQKMAIELREKSGLAVGLIKKGLHCVEEFDPLKAYEYLRELILFNMTAPDAKEGLSAFTEKRQPKWTHQ